MDLCWTLKQKTAYYRQPEGFFNRYFSQGPLDTPSTVDAWVSAKFATGAWDESTLILGDDLGNVGIYNVDGILNDRKEKLLYKFPAHKGAIMDVMSVPNDRSKVVTVSGDSTIRLWDLNAKDDISRQDSIFRGHDGSVRSISVSSQPNIFVTGGRDGSVRIWDSRTVCCRKTGSKSSKFAYKGAHALRQGKSPYGKTPRKPKEAPISVTSVVFIDDYLVASASSVASTGIKIWDTRKPPHNDHAVSLNCYPIHSVDNKERAFGVTSLALDRTGTRLFAACTNSVVYEYDMSSALTQRVNTYTGATIRDYYTQVSCCPTADMLICGSEDRKAYVWDLQPQYEYVNEDVGDMADVKRSRHPKWTLGGHDSKVLSASWSKNSEYILTLDNELLRVWSQDQDVTRLQWSCCAEDEQLDVKQQPTVSFERAEPCKLNVNDETLCKIDGMKISPPRRRTNSFYASPQKRNVKRPLLVSPFKPISPSTSGMSPRKKIFKASSPQRSPLMEKVESPRRIQLKPVVAKRRCSVGAFYKRYPTEELPNMVYKRFISNLLGDNEQQPGEELSKTAKTRIDDWWTKSSKVPCDVENMDCRSRLPSVSEFNGSVCDRVVVDNHDKSPKKLTVKLTPVKETRGITSSAKSAKKTEPRRKPSRNLLDYFNKITR